MAALSIISFVLCLMHQLVKWEQEAPKVLYSPLTTLLGMKDLCYHSQQLALNGLGDW